MSERKDKLLTRRMAIQGAASLVGGTFAVAQLGGFMARAAAAATENPVPAFFDADQFSLIERVVDVMIPDTDTPGALAAGVHHFIDLMLDEWASPERQERYSHGLQDLRARLQALSGEDFMSSSNEQQLDILRDLDQAAFAAAGTDSFNSFYKEFKKLVLFGYYSSEVGATVELQYEALTPEYKACVPIEDIGRAWFWLGFSYGL